MKQISETMLSDWNMSNYYTYTRLLIGSAMINIGESGADSVTGHILSVGFYRKLSSAGMLL